jgi:hypothetical protein
MSVLRQLYVGTAGSPNLYFHRNRLKEGSVFFLLHFFLPNSNLDPNPYKGIQNWNLTLNSQNSTLYASRSDLVLLVLYVTDPDPELVAQQLLNR